MSSSKAASAIADPPSAGPSSSSTGPSPPPPTSRFELPGLSSTPRPDNAAMLHSVSRDFRSDTVTIPTDRMFTEMALASRGDDVFREDVTTSGFEDSIARLTGKESALFVVSGTASNQLALRTHLAGCVPPSSVLMDSRAHIHANEAGALAMISQATTLAIKPEKGRRHLTWEEDVKPNLVPDDGNIHYCPTRVVALENTLWGSIFPQQEVERISQECRQRGVIMHLDGARLWNVSAKTGRSMEELCRPFDTVSLCLSKGLGAPVGSILVGPKSFTERARHFRKLLGGGVRQIGPLVAAARVAVEDHFPKLAHTHALASWMATQLSQQGVRLTEGGEPETNMLFIDVSPLGFTNDELNARLTTQEGIKAWAPRIVVHHQIEPEAVRRFVEVVAEMKEEVKRDGKVGEANGMYMKKGAYSR